jgi:hypothetical protein
MPFLIGIPDTLPHALSEDFYQEKFPDSPGFSGKIPDR